MERVKSEGPLSSKDFKSDKKNGSGWWEWKPAKIALELLYWRGELMVKERQNFHKIYDLTERVLPEDVDLKLPSDSEVASFLVNRAIKAMGIAREVEIRRFLQPDSGRDSDFRAVDKISINSTIKEKIENREILRVNIQGNETDDWYVYPESIQNMPAVPVFSNQTYLLSPFDNLVIQRDRLKTLFDFDYALECYVPAAKRKFGYFVLPILWNGKLVGRLDPKADRKNKTLLIQNLVFEEGFEQFDAFLPSFKDSLQQFAAFNDWYATLSPDQSNR